MLTLLLVEYGAEHAACIGTPTLISSSMGGRNPGYLDAMSGDEWSIEEDGLARFRGSGSPFAPPIAWTSPTPIYGNWG